MMRRHNIGDIVLCKKYSVEMMIHYRIDKPGCTTEPYINDRWFNRKAEIIDTFKNYMDTLFGTDTEDRDEYKIRFLDDDATLAWVSGEDLIPMNYFE